MQISKVMIVDDDPVIRRIAEISLTTVANWKVVLAASGAEALKLVPDARPDLILLDMTEKLLAGFRSSS
jgi:CheY-like chemotaxis protein